MTAKFKQAASLEKGAELGLGDRFDPLCKEISVIASRTISIGKRETSKRISVEVETAEMGRLVTVPVVYSSDYEIQGACAVYRSVKRPEGYSGGSERLPVAIKKLDRKMVDDYGLRRRYPRRIDDFIFFRPTIELNTLQIAERKSELLMVVPDPSLTPTVTRLVPHDSYGGFGIRRS